VNYDNLLVVTITVTCYSWAPFSGNHLLTCGVIFWLHLLCHTGPDCIVSVFDNEDEFMVLQAEFQFRVSWLYIKFARN